MNRKRLKQIKDSNAVLKIGFEFITSFYAWFLNYIVAVIPFWCVRKFFYKISGLKLGKDARIGLHTRVIRPARIVIGDRTIINEYCYLDGRGGLQVGDDCSISIYTKIITASHRVNSLEFSYCENSVKINNLVWVGCEAIILDGSLIEKGCIIGAGAVIKGTTEPFGIYIGNPATKIRERNPNIDYKLDFHPFFR